MDVLALILAFVALAVFLIEAVGRRVSPTVAFVPLGLALLAASWICQATTITDKLVNW